MITSDTKECYIEITDKKRVTIFKWSTGEGATIILHDGEIEKACFSGTWHELNAIAMGIAGAQTK